MGKQQGKPKGAVIPKSLEWEEFYLKKHVICRLLNLCTLGSLFVMGVVGIMLYRGIEIQPALIGVFITSVATILGKVIFTLIKQTKE